MPTVVFHTEEGWYTRNVCVIRQFWHFLIITTWNINWIFSLCYELRYLLLILQMCRMFVEDCNRYREYIHLLSFNYDFHLCKAQLYLNGSQRIFNKGYEITNMLKGLLLEYSKCPLFARNRLCNGNILLYSDCTRYVHVPRELSTHPHLLLKISYYVRHKGWTISLLRGGGGWVILNKYLASSCTKTRSLPEKKITQFAFVQWVEKKHILRRRKRYVYSCPEWKFS